MHAPKPLKADWDQGSLTDASHSELAAFRLLGICEHGSSQVRINGIGLTSSSGSMLVDDSCRCHSVEDAVASQSAADDLHVRLLLGVSRVRLVPVT